MEGIPIRFLSILIWYSPFLRSTSRVYLSLPYLNTRLFVRAFYLHIIH